MTVCTQVGISVLGFLSLPVVARSPELATGPTEGLRCQLLKGDLRSRSRRGREIRAERKFPGVRVPMMPILVLKNRTKPAEMLQRLGESDGQSESQDGPKPEEIAERRRPRKSTDTCRGPANRHFIDAQTRCGAPGAMAASVRPAVSKTDIRSIPATAYRKVGIGERIANQGDGSTCCNSLSVKRFLLLAIGETLRGIAASSHHRLRNRAVAVEKRLRKIQRT